MGHPVCRDSPFWHVGRFMDDHRRAAWKACKLSGLSKRVRLFWLAPSFQEGLRTLETRPADNPFHALATEGMVAATQYTDGPEKLRERMGMAEWLTENLRGCIDESMAKMQDGLSVLASIGATAPFIGLFGTVWGIYHALVSLGISGQASIDRIAGRSAESLVMTALRSGCRDSGCSRF